MTQDPTFSDQMAAWVPRLDQHALTLQAQGSISYRLLVASGLIFSIGMVLRFLRELLKVQRGERADWLKPIVHFIVVMMCLRHYESIVSGTITFITHLGEDGSKGSRMQELFTERWLRYQSQVSADRSRWFGALSMLNGDFMTDAFVAMGYEISYFLLQVAVLALRCIQLFFLAAFIKVGPLLISFSFLGWTLAPFATSWFLALVEVSAWSWLLDILTQIFANSFALHGAETMNLPRELITNLTFIIMVATVPVLAAMLLRGQTAAGVGNLVLSVTQAAALGAMKFATSAPGSNGSPAPTPSGASTASPPSQPQTSSPPGLVSVQNNAMQPARPDSTPSGAAYSSGTGPQGPNHPGRTAAPSGATTVASVLGATSSGLQAVQGAKNSSQQEVQRWASAAAHGLQHVPLNMGSASVAAPHKRSGSILDGDD